MKKITKEWVLAALPIRPKDSYKNKMGHILCIGGNQEMGGAISLTAMAALYSGAGLVTVASDLINLPALHAKAPEIMFSDLYDLKRLGELIDRADVIVIGPGLGRNQEASQVMAYTLKEIRADQFLIIDADAIHLMAENKYPSQAQIIYTPHHGEWKKLSGLGTGQMAPEINQRIQRELKASLVLKASPSQVYLEDEIWLNTTGNPAQATAGMGDTLAGIIAGFLGQYPTPKEAILSAVYIHSYTADHLAQSHYVTLASRLIEEIPLIMKELLNEKIAKDH